MFCRTLSKYTRLITDPQITERVHSSDVASNLCFLPIFNKDTFLLLVLIMLVSMNYPKGRQLRFLLPATLVIFSDFFHINIFSLRTVDSKQMRLQSDASTLLMTNYVSVICLMHSADADCAR